MVVDPTIKGVEHRKLAVFLGIEHNLEYIGVGTNVFFMDNRTTGGVDIFMKAERLFFSSKWSWQHVSEK